VKDCSSNKIHIELDETLSEISKVIPVCVISSKDFGFLCDKTRFAGIVLCITGIETIILKRQVGNELIHIKNDGNVLFDTHLTTDIDTLTDNSVLLTSLAEEISQTFHQVLTFFKVSMRRI
jgi:hypothetical protein